MTFLTEIDKESNCDPKLGEISFKLLIYTKTGTSKKVASLLRCTIIETAKANGHNPYQYLSVVLTKMPCAEALEDYEALLPWNVTPEQIKQRYAALPVPVPVP